jgi:glycolate oxidase iron-sulfur subunit
MRTQFSLAQLSDPLIADAEKSLRACMHCGICTATCPTYVLLGDERDGPRGRIVMMQRMLEHGGIPTRETVFHLDRCLSCLGCRTACPSSVDYARLIDTSRAHIEMHYRRPLRDRLLRTFIATVMSRPNLLRPMLALARLGRAFAGFVPGRIGAMMRTGAAQKPRPSSRPVLSTGPARTVGMMPGCVQAAVAPQIDEAAAHVLARRGLKAVPLAGAGCCGALAFHLGRTEEAKRWARKAIEAFERQGEEMEAILVTSTGCEAHLKDLGHLFRGDPVWEPRAASFARKISDLSELVVPAPPAPGRNLRVAYHAPCSAQFGLKLGDKPELLLKAAGFDVFSVPEGHLCCGSAGSYSILQPEIAAALKARKKANILSVRPDLIATANIGCLLQLSGPEMPPVIHLAELLDWIDGGDVPPGLMDHRAIQDRSALERRAP